MRRKLKRLTKQQQKRPKVTVDASGSGRDVILAKLQRIRASACNEGERSPPATHDVSKPRRVLRSRKNFLEAGAGGNKTKIG